MLSYHILGGTNMKHRKKHNNFKKIFILLPFLMVLLLFTYNNYKKPSNKHRNLSFQTQLFNYMSSTDNRKKVYYNAIELNKGSSENTCVYFLAEVLRQNNISIENHICNTSQLINVLEDLGWRKDSDYKNLKPGDICFSTSGTNNPSSPPSHTYIFMKWAKEDSYDYAYVVDNQAKDYDNKIYHLRNIASSASVKGLSKDPFDFFMYK